MPTSIAGANQGSGSGRCRCLVSPTQRAGSPRPGRQVNRATIAFWIAAGLVVVTFVALAIHARGLALLLMVCCLGFLISGRTAWRQRNRDR
jgi:hypothetical protein